MSAGLQQQSLTDPAGGGDMCKECGCESGKKTDTNDGK